MLSPNITVNIVNAQVTSYDYCVSKELLTFSFQKKCIFYVTDFKPLDLKKAKIIN